MHFQVGVAAVTELRDRRDARAAAALAAWRLGAAALVFAVLGLETAAKVRSLSPSNLANSNFEWFSRICFCYFVQFLRDFTVTRNCCRFSRATRSYRTGAWSSSEPSRSGTGCSSASSSSSPGCSRSSPPSASPFPSARRAPAGCSARSELRSEKCIFAAKITFPQTRTNREEYAVSAVEFLPISCQARSEQLLDHSSLGGMSSADGYPNSSRNSDRTQSLQRILRPGHVHGRGARNDVCVVRPGSSGVYYDGEFGWSIGTVHPNHP